MLSPTVDGLLQSLIRIPSVNPEGDPGVDDAGEKGCAEFLAGYLEGLGATVEMRTVLPDRPNVLGRFPADSPDKPVLLFAPHTDTVSVVGMSIDPFGGEARDGRIYGRGASDTKGPMASMLFALQEIRDKISSLPVEIWFAGLMGEEAGQHGARAMAKQIRPDFVAVAEPTDLGIVHAHKGSLWIKLQTTGRAVHASMPEAGENAIDSMLDPLLILRDRVSGWIAEMHSPELGRPTLNIGRITGGTKTNIVPDRCLAMVDIRTVPQMDTGEFVGRLRAELEAASPGIAIDVVESRPLLTDPDNPFIDVLRGSGAPLATAPWFCDAAVFADGGIPSVAIGPGSITQAHTADEFIAIEDLRAGVDFFKKFLTDIPSNIST